jgi:CRISPR-associated protein Csb2
MYALPSVTLSHTRHYMPVIEGKNRKPTLIFDAFVRVSDSAQLVVAWPDVELTDDEHRLLDALVTRLGYLGRAESWVQAELLTDWSGTVNCRPSDIRTDTSTGDTTEPVSVIAPLSRESYAMHRTELLAGSHMDTFSKKELKAFTATLPERLLDALRLDSSDLQAVGWSAPPSAKFVTYQRHYGCFTARSRAFASSTKKPSPWVRLALGGKPLPRIEDAVKVAELVRSASMCEVQKSGLEIPPVISGHGLPSENRHGHAFYLPEDMDHDGRIDHVLIVAGMGLSGEVVDAISHIRKLWEAGGPTWPVLFEAAGNMAIVSDGYFSRARTWTSVSPYLHPWFAKRGFGYVEQLKRECRERGITEPISIEVLETVDGGRGRQLRAVQFRRIRGKRGLRQPDRLGKLLRLRFADPVAGPLALGFGCHFGLGMFRPDSD